MSRNSHSQKKRQYIFSELTNLCLYDVKAQKKTMSMKKFRNIPLNRQQLMELKFNTHVEEQQQFGAELQQTQFRVRIGKRKKQKLLQRLQNSKKPILTLKTTGEMNISETENIIKKCSKLKDKILTENRIQKLQKYAEREYSTLLEQSKWCLAIHCKNT